MSLARGVAALVICFLAAQSADHAISVPERITLARPLLLHAEEAASSMPPTPCAFLLYRASGAWLDIDLPHAIELDRRAFAAARQIDSLPLRQDIEHDILSDLLPLSPSSVRDLIPQAEPETQKKLSEAYRNYTQPDLSPYGFISGQGTTSYVTEEGARTLPLSGLDMGLEFTIPMNLAQGLGVTGSTVSFYTPASPEAVLLGTDNTCPTDVPHILGSIDTVPFSRRVPTECSGPNGAWCSYGEEFPRADVLNKVAERCTHYPGKSDALVALTAEVQLIAQLPPSARPRYLANAADLYLRLGEKKSASECVQNGFEVAGSLLVEDRRSSRLQQLPRAVWPSAEVYRTMISLGVNANFERTRQSVEAISDAELRELDRVMMARTLLGIPVRREIIYYSDGSRMMRHSEPGYENN
jgi:hypothetical protein